jgi:maltooligosyltrehalose trehalohydrolase
VEVFALLLERQLSNFPLFHGPRRISKSEFLFTVWAPFAKKMSLQIENDDDSNLLKMTAQDRGYFTIIAEADENAKYWYLINGKTKRPDPAARFQPDGVHGPSSLVSYSTYQWQDDSWKGTPQSELIIYEIHVGTFSGKGTFESIIPHLDYLKELGITAIEIMPVAQFPGERNWGYDGVDLFAPQNSYGGPIGLKKLVDNCHRKQLSVILDVVYNHVGPEGNYLGDFGPYFSYKYRTPWGPAINYDESGSDEVRRFILQNAESWIEEFHIDGLRLDAIDKIFDYSPKNILLEIEKSAHRVAETQGKIVHVIGEVDLNDPKIIRPEEVGGYSLDAQWSDDFHHSVHAYLTGERFRYYSDFGELQDIAKSLSSAFVYDGKYSNFRGRTHGAPAIGIDGEKFVYYLQNHDQVGNRLDGKRLSAILPFEKLKVAVALLFLSQSIPLLFMGEEYAEKAPFYYFVSHSKKKLVKAVREGRTKEHEHNPGEGNFMDPQSVSTFLQSKLHPELKSKSMHKVLLEYHKGLISLRKSLRPLRNFERNSQQVELLDQYSTIVMNRQFEGELVKCIFVLGNKEANVENPLPRNSFRKVFDSTSFVIPKERNQSEMKSDLDDRMVELSPFSATVFSS